MSPRQVRQTASFQVLERVIDGQPRREGCHNGDEHDLNDDGHIPADADRKGAKQRPDLVLPGRSPEPCTEEIGERKHENRRGAADGTALEAENEEMTLKFTGDE